MNEIEFEGERPMQPEPSRLYRDALYASYVDTHAPALDAATRQTLGRYFRANFARHLPLDRSAAILDIACGAGEFVEYLRRDGYANVTGVDVSSQPVEAASAAGVSGVEVGDAFAFLATRPQSFDAIVAIDFLEHLTKDEALDLLRLVRAALRPGGRLSVQTCNAASPMFGRVRYGDFTHETAFTARSIAQAFGAAGLTTVGVFEVATPVHGAASAVRSIAWRSMRAAVAAYVIAETGVTRGHVLTQNLIAVASRDDVMRVVR